MATAEVCFEIESRSVPDVIVEEQAVELLEEADKSFPSYEQDIWNF